MKLVALALATTLGTVQFAQFPFPFNLPFEIFKPPPPPVHKVARPVIKNQIFYLTTPVHKGQTVGRVRATNHPTSWKIKKSVKNETN